MADDPTEPPENLDNQSEKRLQLAVDAAGMGLWDWNILTGEVVWSRQCRALYGLPPDAEILHLQRTTSFMASVGCTRNRSFLEPASASPTRVGA